MTVDQREEDITENPDLENKMEWMKERLEVETDEELFSKALTLLHQMIEWEDQGYTVGAWKDNLLSREVVRYRIAAEK